MRLPTRDFFGAKNSQKAFFLNCPETGCYKNRGKIWPKLSNPPISMWQHRHHPYTLNPNVAIYAPISTSSLPTTFPTLVSFSPP